MPFETVHAVIERELGRPADEVFEWIGEQPTAAAPIGQVHAAHLHDGREVVALVDGDAGALHQCWVDLGFIEAGGKLDEQRLFDWWAPIFDPGRHDQPLTFTPDFAAWVISRNFNVLGEWPPAIGARSTTRSRSAPRPHRPGPTARVLADRAVLLGRPRGSILSGVGGSRGRWSRMARWPLCRPAR